MAKDTTFHAAMMAAAIICDSRYKICPTAIGAMMLDAKLIERHTEFIPSSRQPWECQTFHNSRSFLSYWPADPGLHWRG